MRRVRAINEPDFSYRTLLADFFARRAERNSEARPRPPIFTPYAGSESYPPHVYAAPIVAALVGNLFGADFIVLVYAMRLAGLAFATALAAYAISVTPRLKWAFFLIALLPSAIYGRAVLSADGCAFGFALIVTALCLRAALGNGDERVPERAFWMTLCVSSKPSQIAFVLLETMTRSFKLLPERWRSVALVVLPALVLLPLWMFAVSADVAAWRIAEAGGVRPEEFSPALEAWIHDAAPAAFSRGADHQPRLHAGTLSTTDRHSRLARHRIAPARLSCAWDRAARRLVRKPARQRC